MALQKFHYQRRLPRAPNNFNLPRKKVSSAQMVRTVSHVEDEEAPESSSPTERIRVDQKVDASRSKHSETEQRRRSKINERFQILRDLIPENDQKRDKASLLLEVIQYIQFLQEKLQIYEGSYQGWSPELTKLTPWKFNSGPGESFLEQAQLERHMSDNGDLHTSISNAQNSVESDLLGASLYKPTDNPPIAASQMLPLNLPMEAPTFEGDSSQSLQECFPDTEQVTHHSRSQFWRGRSCVDDCSAPIYTVNQDGLKSESGEASISNTYSQELLDSLTNALQSSGVDLSQASISVQLDIGKQTNGGSTTAMFNTKDHQNPSGLNSMAPGNLVENYEHPHKRFRADQC